VTEKPSILYVEDDVSSQMLMELILRHDMGLDDVTIFADSNDFLARVEVLNPVPDLIFLDIHLQPLDGFQMLSLLREHPVFATRPIIALTASVMNEEIEQLRDAGFNGVIAKPINLETFPEKIHAILDGEELWMIVR
jgi:CheY-like chemotaxis protein